MHQNNPSPLALAAREAAVRGWFVFPLAPGSKRPALRSWESRATTALGRIDPCWAFGAYNVGIATGPSGLVVVDLDVPKHSGDLPPAGAASALADGQDALALLAETAGQPFPSGTFTVRSGSGGRHLYFAAPAGMRLRNTAGVLGWKIDTRAHGGCIVGAGSVVNGRSYRVVDDRAPAPLPGWLAERLAPAPVPQQGYRVAPLALRGRNAAYLRAAVNAEVARVAAAPTSRRNTALYLAAVALGQLVTGGELPAADVTAELTAAAHGVGLQTNEIQRTIASGFRAGARRPRTIARSAA
ncbi:bifunctional DNA primase/polymerase [Streptacidiphilus albus]|uniref:bifunctional DNA primase/polymerase n=1 Tax=Streptacidiphilus albus TaxID=105425 RepID=UPI00054C777F|nr:bifunctional DNA primase/polymerase [Streptacidiphilus albus]